MGKVRFPMMMTTANFTKHKTIFLGTQLRNFQRYLKNNPKIDKIDAVILGSNSESYPLR
jgi:hypothetical protein